MWYLYILWCVGIHQRIVILPKDISLKAIDSLSPVSYQLSIYTSARGSFHDYFPWPHLSLSDFSSYMLTEVPWVHIYNHSVVSKRNDCFIFTKSFFLVIHHLYLLGSFLLLLNNEECACKWEENEIDVPFRAVPSTVVSNSLNIEELCVNYHVFLWWRLGSVLIYGYNDKSLETVLIVHPLSSIMDVDSLLGPLTCLAQVLTLRVLLVAGFIFCWQPYIQSESGLLLSWY